MRTPTVPLPLRRALARHRRAIAVIASAISVVAIITALQPDRGPHAMVLVAARPIAVGSTVSDADLTLLEFPVGLIPAEAITDAADVRGRPVNTPVSERSVLTRAIVATGQSLAAPGFVVVALPLADESLAALVKPGNHLDLIAATASGAGTVLASEVRVVAAPQPESGGLGGLSASRVALVEVTPDVAVKMAQAGRSGGVTIALR